MDSLSPQASEKDNVLYLDQAMAESARADDYIEELLSPWIEESQPFSPGVRTQSSSFSQFEQHLQQIDEIEEALLRLKYYLDEIETLSPHRPRS